MSRVMALSVSEGDWPLIDGWWREFREERPFILAPPHIRQIEDAWKERAWESVDDLWEGFEADHEPLLIKQHIRAIERAGSGDDWETVDDFWAGYAERQRADLAQLRELMATLDKTWTDGNSRFETDPLAANWRPQSQYEGPLRTSVDEEDWSQWLSHLLRTSTGAFAQELLGTPDRSPSKVRREVVFFGERSNRRADILVEYEDVAVSIEVKTGDENYGKTPHTAMLIERHDDRDWSHILLLQKDKLPRLRQTFDDTLDESDEDTPKLRSDQSADIDVRYWQDVSRLLRRMLLDGSEPDCHWKASAYIFITLIEQRLLKFHSFAFVDSVTAGSAPFDTGNASDSGIPPGTTEPARGSVTSDLHRLVTIEPAAQIDYLRSVLQGDDDHE